jgi:hypothetical protein
VSETGPRRPRAPDVALRVPAAPRRLLRAGVIVLVAALALSGAVLALRAPADAPTPTTDPRDTGGPLDLTEATLTQQDIRMDLHLQTAGAWTSTDLIATPGRELCVTLLRGEADGATPRGRICVTRRDARTALSYTPLTAEGTADGAPRRLAARATRPTPTTLEATFLPAAAGLTVGPYAWRAESAWTDAADPACATTCADRFPDDGDVAGDIALLADPPCFGAAARDPANPCENPDLRDSVTPLPAQAKAVADPYCDKREHSRLITACGFGAAPDDAVRTFAVVGDSHAANFKTALAVVTLAKRWRGVSIVRNSCPATEGTPILPTSTGSRRCRDWNRQVRAWLAAHREVGTVFLTAHRGASVRATGGQSPTEAVRAGYRDEIRALLALGKRVVVIRDPPSSSKVQMDCTVTAIAAGLPAARTCRLDRAFALRPDDLVLAARGVHSGQVRIIDLTRQFCDATRCLSVIGGVLVRHDATHLTQTFAATLGPFLVRALDG